MDKFIEIFSTAVVETSNLNDDPICPHCQYLLELSTTGGGKWTYQCVNCKYCQKISENDL